MTSLAYREAGAWSQKSRGDAKTGSGAHAAHMGAGPSNLDTPPLYGEFEQVL